MEVIISPSRFFRRVTRSLFTAEKAVFLNIGHALFPELRFPIGEPVIHHVSRHVERLVKDREVIIMAFSEGDCDVVFLADVLA